MSELEIYKKQNMGNQSGWGARPALLIVDFVNGFSDPEKFGGGNIALLLCHAGEAAHVDKGNRRRNVRGRRRQTRGLGELGQWLDGQIQGLLRGPRP